MVPAFFLYLLLQYCYQKEDGFSIARFIKMGMCVIIVFLMSFGPFLVHDPIKDMKQILSRLFPFQRGLTHAYWAPNFWALYNFMDKIALTKIGRASWREGL